MVAMYSLAMKATKKLSLSGTIERFKKQLCDALSYCSNLMGTDSMCAVTSTERDCIPM